MRTPGRPTPRSGSRGVCARATATLVPAPSPRLFIRYTWSSISSNIAWLSGCSIHSIIGFAIVLYLLLAFLLRLGNLFTAVPQVLNVVVNFRRRRFGENRLRLLDNRAAPSRVRCAGPNFMGSAGQTAPGDRRVVSAQGLSSETSPKQSFSQTRKRCQTHQRPLQGTIKYVIVLCLRIARFRLLEPTFPSPWMIPDRSSPSRVSFAASRPGPLRADLGRRAVHEGKGGGGRVDGQKENLSVIPAALSRSRGALSPVGP